MSYSIILSVSLSSNVNRYKYQGVYEFIDESERCKNINICTRMRKSLSMNLYMSVCAQVCSIDLNIEKKTPCIVFRSYLMVISCWNSDSVISLFRIFVLLPGWYAFSHVAFPFFFLLFFGPSKHFHHSRYIDARTENIFGHFVNISCKFSRAGNVCEIGHMRNPPLLIM